MSDLADPDGSEGTEAVRLLTEAFGGQWVAYAPESRALKTVRAAQFSRTDSGRLVLSGLVLLGDALTTDVIRKVPVVELENSINVGREVVEGEVERLPPLERTPGMSPEEFSQLVALHYKTWARGVPHPVAAMAASADTKLATVHTWVREARLRGFLPPGRRTKSMECL